MEYEPVVWGVAMALSMGVSFLGYRAGGKRSGAGFGSSQMANAVPESRL